MKKQSSLILYLTTLLLVVPQAAFAHHVMTTDQSPALGGFSLPLHGLDHALALIAVGLWAAVLPAPRASRLALGSFFVLMGAGAAVGMTMRVESLLVEQGILLSVFAFGLLLALLAKLPPLAVAAVSGFFALFHGYACGAALPAQWFGAAPAWAFAGGLLLATLALLLAGLGIGGALQRLTKSQNGIRWTGGLLSLCALWLWAS